MEKHVTAVAALHIGYSIFGILIGILIFVVLGWASAIAHNEQAMILLPTIAVLTGGTIIIHSILAIIGAVGLLKHKNWARILILVISGLDLVHIPFGTALAVYSIWALVQDDTAALFGTRPVAAVQLGGNPPPRNPN